MPDIIIMKSNTRWRLISEKKRDVNMNSKKNEKAIIENLMDAGCDGNTITAFVEDFREEKIEDGHKAFSGTQTLTARGAS